MERKKRQMEKEKLKEEIRNKEEAERMKQNLRELNEKTAQLNSKKSGGLVKMHARTSKLKKFVCSRPGFTLERWVRGVMVVVMRIIRRIRRL
jgi:hypothetical protein